MPKNSPTILIVGHGSVSGKGQLIDYLRYNVLLPVKEGYALDITSYNLKQDLCCAYFFSR